MSRSESPFASRLFVTLIGANSMLLLHDTVLLVLLPMWIIQRTSLPTSMVAVFLAINTILTVLIQLLVPRTHIGQLWKPFLTAAGMALVVMCAAFAIAESEPSLAAASAVIGVLGLTLGENCHSIAAWEISFKVAPPDRSAEYLSVFQLSNAIKSVIGPTFVTGLILGMEARGWFFLAIIFAVGTVAVLQTAARLINAMPKTSVVEGRVT